MYLVIDKEYRIYQPPILVFQSGSQETLGH